MKIIDLINKLKEYPEDTIVTIRGVQERESIVPPFVPLDKWDIYYRHENRTMEISSE